MALSVLPLFFDVTMTHLSKYLQFARRNVVKVLLRNDYAKISMPSLQKLEEHRWVINR